MITAVFFLLAAIVVGSALNVLFQRHVMYSALSLIVMLAGVSGLFVLMHAEFIAMIQVIVYAGAIMVLFTFVIMLLNLPADEDGPDRLRWLKFVGIPMALFLFAMVVASIWHIEAPPAAETLAGTPAAIGRSLFSTYLLPFEVTSILILVALMGAVVFAKKDL